MFEDIAINMLIESLDIVKAELANKNFQSKEYQLAKNFVISTLAFLESEHAPATKAVEPSEIATPAESAP